MRRFLTTLIVLFSFYYIFQIIFVGKSKGFTNDYKVTTNGVTYQVNEVYTANREDEIDNYYITITNGNYVYNYQTYKSLLKSKKVITDIYSVENCILPIFKQEGVIFDITCTNGTEQSYLYNIDKPSTKLLDFKNKMIEKGYEVTKFKDNFILNELDSQVRFNKDNIVDGHYLILTHYKGAYVLSSLIPSRMYKHNLLNRDAYASTLSGFASNYYILADYDSKFSFSNFYIINYKSNNNKLVETNQNISFNVLVQGELEGKLYFIDIDNVKQYSIDPKAEKVVEVGNKETGAVVGYEEGKYIRNNIYDVIKNKNTFKTYSSTNNSEYIRIDKIGNELSGYIYSYKKVGNLYYCFKKNIRSDIESFAFVTNDINSVVYIDDYVYFKNKNNISYYKEDMGTRILIINKEMEFNPNIKFAVSK
jgi:hypothetical protein